ncbi:MAG: MOSC domain-containing protein [Anaerolineae bacterium]|nr:MOSC domain-containing protein [Anaerolineae bacterium]
MQGRIVAVCTSTKKGVAKKDVGQAEARVNWGLVGDAHAADWHRQVSLLALESIEKMRALGLKVRPGSFAENLTTEGIDLLALPIGSSVRVGNDVILEITQHGKICHEKCAIYRAAGDCVMPREGIFARVITGGMIRTGDLIMPIPEGE